MKILWVKPGRLLPLDTGGKLRTYNIIRHLSQTQGVTYLCYYQGKRDEAYERELLTHLPRVVSVCTPLGDFTRLGLHLDYVRHLTWRAPYAVAKFASPIVRKLLEDWIADRRFDVAVCDFLASAMNFPETLATPTALFQHNVESMLWKRRAEFEGEWLNRIVSRFEYAKMARFEPEQMRRFHHVIAVSEVDREAMSKMVASDKISVVPTGVDLSQYWYDPAARPAGALVVFTGSMDWRPNIDAVKFFCREIWPRVLTRVPAARFRIVGRDPDPSVKRLSSASVEVTGIVPSIVDHLREAAVIVVPLRIGGGTRIKIYEAMATGKAIVSTTVGAEGLDVEHGRDLLLEDTPSAFADAIVTFLQDENMRTRYESAAATTSRKYDWSVITQRFAEVLHRTIDAAADCGTPSSSDSAGAGP
jgi:polysaccharide biosynthesis protein PslH